MKYTITELQYWGKKEIGSSLEVDILLSHCLRRNSAYLYAWPDYYPSIQEIEVFFEQIARRKAGEPIAYLLEQKEFWSLSLKVSKDVLIPRPETELLVEEILLRFPDKKRVRVLELGTGSGAIALALAIERPEWEIVAIDSSTAAIEIAKYNSNQLSVRNLEFYVGNWFSALAHFIPDKDLFDVVVSNPPYIAASDPHLFSGDLRYEPKAALISGEDGLNDLRQIIAQANQYLVSEGLLIVEHGFEQGQAVQNLLKVHGFKNIETIKDLSQQDRVSLAYKKSIEPNNLISQ